MRQLLYPLGILIALLFTNVSQAQFFGPYGSYYGSSYSQFGTSFSMTSYNFRSSYYLNINNGFPINNYYYSNQFAYRYPYNYIAPVPVIVRPVVVQPVYILQPQLAWYNPPVSIYGPMLPYQPYYYPGWWLR
jgi:hypothetical protein